MLLYSSLARPGSSRWPFSVPLDQIADECGPACRAAEPFPHVVLDNLFRGEVLDAALDEWPSRSDVDWNRQLLRSAATGEWVSITARDLLLAAMNGCQ